MDGRSAAKKRTHHSSMSMSPQLVVMTTLPVVGGSTTYIDDMA